MNWIEVRKSYPNKWVVLEGLKTRKQGNQKYYDNISVMESFDDGNLALKACNSFHKEYPKRDFHFIHTTHEKLEIPLKQWLFVLFRYLIFIFKMFILLLWKWLLL
jgi:hypothetical protein